MLVVASDRDERLKESIDGDDKEWWIYVPLFLRFFAGLLSASPSFKC